MLEIPTPVSSSTADAHPFGGTPPSSSTTSETSGPI